MFKNIFWVLLCGLAGTAVAFEQPQVYQLKAKDHVLILGDSTSAEGYSLAGHIRMVDEAQYEQIPDRGVVVRANATPGTRMTDLPKGMDSFLSKSIGQSHAPTVAIINFGLNDSKDGEKNVMNYIASARQAVSQLRTQNLTVILCTPTLWGGLEQTRAYAQAIRDLAAELKTPVIDLYAAHADHFVKNIRNGQQMPGTMLTRDGVHFTLFGEIFQARIYLQAFGLKPVMQKSHLRYGGRMESGGFRFDALGQNMYGGGKVKVEPEIVTNAPTPSNPGWSETWPMEQQIFAPGTKVTLTATPNAGNTFLRWERFEPNMVFPETSPKLTVTIEENMWISAVFKPIEAKKP